MALIQIPQVVGLIVCERLEPNPETGLTSLVGIVQAMRFPHFPSEPHAFTVYVALTDGIGEGTLRLLITRLETNEEVYYHDRWVTFPNDRLLVLNMVIPVSRCVFPAPGRYSFGLFLDKQLVSERALPVFHE
jgi:hypothetical protein